MLYYPSKTNDRLNKGVTFEPDRLIGRVMLNPIYPIRQLAPNTRAICDSGAFQDLGKRPRLSFAQALDRQLRYEEQLRWHTNDHNFSFEALVIYDQMAGVDEAVIDGRKTKVRGTRDAAAHAVAETLRAAAYYDRERERIAGALCFAGQGIDPDQYIHDCVHPMSDYMRPGDWFAFGGFCITGRFPKVMMPLFRETIPRVMDNLIPFGITRYHLLGVTMPEAVQFAAREAQARGVVISTDSSAIEVGSVVSGAEYVNGTWTRGRWTKADKYINYCPVELAHKNLVSYTQWALKQGGNEV